MEAFIKELTRKLEEKLQQVPQTTAIKQKEGCIQMVSETLVELQIHLSQYIFNDKAQEITFFKYLLPPVYSKLLYYQRVLELEINCPVSKESQKHFYESELQHTNHYLERKRHYVAFYRSGMSFLDDEYFIRNPEVPGHNIISSMCDSTIGSMLFSRIICSEMLIKEIERRLVVLDRKETLNEKPIEKRLKWKGPLVGLVELGYAFKEAGAIEEPLHVIFECFENFFSVQLKNTSRTFQEILSRKREEVVYLDKLTASLKERKDRMNLNYKPRK